MTDRVSANEPARYNRYIFLSPITDRRLISNTDRYIWKCLTSYGSLVSQKYLSCCQTMNSANNVRILQRDLRFLASERHKLSCFDAF